MWTTEKSKKRKQRIGRIPCSSNDHYLCNMETYTCCSTCEHYDVCDPTENLRCTELDYNTCPSVRDYILPYHIDPTGRD